MNRVIKIIAGVKALIVAATALALILEGFIAGKVNTIEKETDSLVKIEEQIRDLLAYSAKHSNPATPVDPAKDFPSPTVTPIPK